MPCSPLVDPSCVEPVDHGGHAFGPPLPDLTAELAGNALESAAKAIQSAVGWFVSNTATWWLKTPSPDLEKEHAIGFLRDAVQPLTVAVAVLALLVVAARTTLTRRAAPLGDAGTGLAVLAIVTAIGTALPNLLLRWGDSWSDWVLKSAAGGGFSARMTQILTIPSGVPAAFVLVMSLIALMVGIVQAILLLFRQASLIVLAGLLPLAAAGMLTSATRPWLKRVSGWMVALVFYKPLAAGVYATAFMLIGTGTSLHAILLGHTMMLLSLLAFPVLLRLFSWLTPGSETPGGGRVLGAVLGGATAVGALRSYSGGTAAEHAGFLDRQLGGDSPTGSEPPQTPPAGEPARPTDARPPVDEPAPGTQQADEPVGPTAVGAWNRGRKQGRAMIRWIGDPTGSGDDSAPTGAEGGGGGS